MKKNAALRSLFAIALSVITATVFAVPSVSISSVAVPASTLTQGSQINLLYIAKMNVSTDPVTVNTVQFTLSGTYDGNDLGFVRVYYNATAPSITGATLVNYITASFAAPHTYSLGSINRTIAAGASGYFLIAVDVDNTANDNRTIKINGATNPLTFGYSTAPNITNSQTDAGGLQTIQAADITVKSNSVPAATLQQGSQINLLYIAQMSVTTQPVTVTTVQFTLSGTHDADDLGFVRVYYNATAPSITGATLVNYITASFAAPHTYSLGSINRTIAAGASGYFLIAVDVNNAANDNRTIKINGASNPLTFGYSTAPNITNSQTDAGGLQTIQAADITVKSNSVPAATLQQGAQINLLYIAQMSVTTQPVTVNTVQFTLAGTHDADDLGFVRVYYNATAPSITGATLVNYITAGFAAPHTYSLGSINRTIGAGASGYFLIAVDVDNTANDNRTIKINGATNPLTFGYSTAPNITNSQTDAGGLQTIQAADITVTSNSVPAATLQQGAQINLLYIAQMSVTTQPVTVTTVQFTLSGTHDADDLGFVRVYYNATAPSITGATLVNYITVSFAAPHTYSLGSINRTIAAGSSGYFLIAVDVDNAANDNRTIKINGATNPLTFGYSTAPNITNSQADAGGLQTIQAADITVTTVAVPASNLALNSQINLLYVAQMDVSTQPVTVNSVQFTLSGTHDADDLGFVRVYYNATAPSLTGATLVNYITASFAAPHTYSLGSINRTIGAGASGYFLIAVDIDNTATNGNTIKINGATNPLVFGYSTGPNVTNSQTDAAGLKTIGAAASTTYTFTGNGNWNNSANWQNNLVPPSTLPSTATIIINPAAGGQCILNVSQTITPGGTLTVAAGKRLVIAGDIGIQQ